MTQIREEAEKKREMQKKQRWDRRRRR